MQATPLDLDIERVPLSGVTLIEASAGTGKTYTLAALFVRLLLEGQLTVDQILVVTYTRAATAELRVRIRKRIVQSLDALEGVPPADDPLLIGMCERAREQGQLETQRKLLSEALLAFDEAAIFTIHGFCQRVLKRHAFESGATFDAELSEDQSLMLEEVVQDFWARELSHATEPFARALRYHGLDLASMVRFVRRALPNPELQVLPQEPTGEREPPQAVTAAFEAARAAASVLWLEQRTRIVDLLLESGLNRGQYNFARVQDTFAPGLDRLNTLTAVQLPSWLSKLTPEALDKACKKGCTPPVHPFFDACALLLARAQPLRAAGEQAAHAFMHELLAYARTELARRAEAKGQLGFDDLLLRLFEALQSEQGPRLAEVVQRSYRAALIDEFQDTDPVQLEVFRRIYSVPLADADARPALFLIGDPKQAIYAFRGADIFAYLAAARGGIDRVHTLTVNYRSDPGLLESLEQLYARAALPFVFEEIQYRPVAARPGATDALAPCLEILLLSRDPGREDKPMPKAEAEAQLPARIAAEIARLLASDERLAGARIQPGDIAVLCRTNAQAAQVQVALRELAVPAVLDGDASVFDSSMAEELGRFLWAMAEPADAARVRAALATAALGQNAQQLLALETDEAAWDEWVARFHRFQSLWQTRGFLRALHTLCEELSVSARLLALPDGERRYTDLWHLAELLHEEEQLTRKGPHALLDFYRRVRDGAAAREGMALEDVQVRLESDARAVTLTTIHKSKGLEYSIVYCPYLWVSAQLSNGDKHMPLFHDRQGSERASLLLPIKEDSANSDVRKHALELAQCEALAEGTRLLYVALTRAKHRLSLVWGALTGYEDSALGYLLQPAAALSTRPARPARTDAALYADLRALTQTVGDRASVRSLAPAEGAPRYQPERPALSRLSARTASFPVLPAARVGSFSALIESDKWQPRTESEPLDRDALTSASTALEPVQEEPRVPLADFPSGAGFGHLVHAVYEHADFCAPAEPELLTTVQDVLREYAADVSWAQPLTAALHDSLHTPLSAAGGELPSLAQLSRQQRLNELEFMFPVAEAALADTSQAALSPRQLSNLLGEHARSDLERGYAAQLARLRFAPLRGFLRGFIDLVAEHDGRYYVLDYKSNRLGETARDYQRAQLEAEMHRHHYTLQYLLYSVAVHRYLGLRLPDYDYDRHFGGVYYLFIRGMSTRHPPGSGVLFERPTRALIEALSTCLSSPEGNA